MTGIKYRVIKRGTTPRQFAHKLKVTMEDLKISMVQFAEETAEHMRQIVTSKKKSDSNKSEGASLVDAIQVQQVGREIIYVGIAESIAPYWKLINYGGSLGGTKGWFVPGHFGGEAPSSNKAGGEFSYSPFSGAGFYVGPETIIPPMNYIEETHMWTRLNFAPFVKKVAQLK